ncbi:MAG: hypothetical protein K6C11_04525 [Bacilli bacterium]|nr:hypothetical protein [Bacilli bacterium]
MDNIDIRLSDMNDSYYFNSNEIVTELLNESNVYPGSQKRIFMSKFLFAIIHDNKQIGFVSCLLEGTNVLSLDLCLLKEYRNLNIADEILYRVVDEIKNSSIYDGESIMINKNKVHDNITVGLNMGDNNIMLNCIVRESNKHKVIDSKNKFGALNKYEK